jgi:hypothetical protein
LVAVVVGELAFERAVVLELDGAVATNLVAFLEAVPVEVGGVGRLAARERRAKRPEGDFAAAFSVEGDRQ